MRRGPKPGSKFCDIMEMLKFLTVIRRGQPMNIYQLHHSRQLRFDTKKIYRYLRYALKLDLVKLAYIDETKFMPSKFYQLTPKGTALLDVGIEHSPKATSTKL
jgi:hypothetical protein